MLPDQALSFPLLNKLCLLLLELVHLEEVLAELLILLVVFDALEVSDGVLEGRVRVDVFLRVNPELLLVQSVGFVPEAVLLVVEVVIFDLDVFIVIRSVSLCLGVVELPHSRHCHFLVPVRLCGQLQALPTRRSHGLARRSSFGLTDD